MEFFNFFLNKDSIYSSDSNFYHEASKFYQKPNFIEDQSSDNEFHGVEAQFETFLDTDEIIIEELSEDDENFRIASENLSQSTESTENFTQNFPCLLCNVTFTSKFNLERHFSSLRHQKTENDFIASSDAEEKISVDEMIIEDPLEIDVHTCKDCLMSFVRMKDLKDHRRKSHSKFKCGKCNRRCKSEIDFTYHMQRHEKSGEYSCRYCWKAFTNNQNCKRHERAHEGVKKFECKVCAKKFDQKSNLLRHLKVHEA